MGCLYDRLTRGDHGGRCATWGALLHDVWRASLQVPAAQLLQSPVPVPERYLPASQLVHEPCALFVSVWPLRPPQFVRRVPSPHASQSEQGPLLLSLLYFPSGQSVHQPSVSRVLEASTWSWSPPHSVRYLPA